MDKVIFHFHHRQVPRPHPPSQAGTTRQEAGLSAPTQAWVGASPAAPPQNSSTTPPARDDAGLWSRDDHVIFRLTDPRFLVL